MILCRARIIFATARCKESSTFGICPRCSPRRLLARLDVVCRFGFVYNRRPENGSVRCFRSSLPKTGPEGWEILRTMFEQMRCRSRPSSESCSCHIAFLKENTWLLILRMRKQQMTVTRVDSESWEDELSVNRQRLSERKLWLSSTI